MNARPMGHAMRPRNHRRMGFLARPGRGADGLGRPSYGAPPRAFTLIELLIAMTLTLMLVYAIAQFYAYVGETVRDGRAQIEMGGQLRAAAQRLQQDLAELTVRVGGRIDPGSAQGVLEIWEGGASDSDANGDQGDGNGDGAFDDVSGFFIPNDLLNANGTPLDANGDGKPDSAMLGDCDDILVMTIRSQGEPFVGRWCVQVPNSNPPQYTYQTVQSNLAEVIWFTTFKDVSGDGLWQMTEPRYLVRRQLLIRPDLALTSPGTPGSNPGDFFLHNDISAHITGPPPHTPIANSLADLSQRENRAIHNQLETPPGLLNNGLRAAQGFMPNTVRLDVGRTASCNHYSLDGIAQFQGEDKMLSNLLAFDVRVYDPYAVLRADNSDYDGQQTTPNAPNDDAQGVLAPGDPGYAYAVLNGFQPMGNGAYVDLWYNRAYQFFPAGPRNTVLQNSAYSWAPNARNFFGGAVWDTWTMAYEKDGFAQGIPANLPFHPVYPARATADWMVDGLDNDGINGVDDPGEAETRPPYPVYVGDNEVDDNFDGNVDDVTENAYARPVPTILRGIEVRIRMYEPGTRQTRQQTVATDFIPE